MTDDKEFKCAGCGAEYSNFQAECSKCGEMVGTCCGIYIKGTKHGEPDEAEMENYNNEKDPVRKKRLEQRINTPGQYRPKTFTRRYHDKCCPDLDKVLP